MAPMERPPTYQTTMQIMLNIVAGKTALKPELSQNMELGLNWSSNDWGDIELKIIQK